MPTSPTNTSPRGNSSGGVRMFTPNLIQQYNTTGSFSIIDLRHGQGGTVQPRSDGFAAASDATLRRSRRALLKTARRLLRRASDYLESHAAQFPLYDPQANVLNRCSIDGKLVQTR